MRIIKVLLLAAIFAVLAMAGLYVFAPPQFVDVAMRVERAVSGLQRKEIQAGGLNVVYLDSGGRGEPLVLVHGFGADKDSWTRVARHLTPRYRVIVPDLPGYGESSSPADVQYRIADGVERLHAFMQAIGLQRAHFGGNSMGGHVVAAYAVAHPNAVGSLWLVANAGVWSAPTSELSRLLAEGKPNPLTAATAEQYREFLAFVMSKPPPLPGALLDVLAARAVAVSALRASQFRDLTEQPVRLEGVIDGLPIPVHILWGADDRLLHVGSVDVLKRLLPQASSTVMPGIGHAPMIEAPKESASDYLAFRDGLAARNVAAQ